MGGRAPAPAGIHRPGGGVNEEWNLKSVHVRDNSIFGHRRSRNIRRECSRRRCVVTVSICRCNYAADNLSRIEADRQEKPPRPRPFRRPAGFFGCFFFFFFCFYFCFCFCFFLPLPRPLLHRPSPLSSKPTVHCHVYHSYSSHRIDPSPGPSQHGTHHPLGQANPLVPALCCRLRPAQPRLSAGCGWWW